MNRIRYFMTLADSITLNESTLKLTHNTYTQDIMANQSKMPLQSGVASRRPTITKATGPSSYSRALSRASVRNRCLASSEICRLRLNPKTLNPNESECPHSRATEVGDGEGAERRSNGSTGNPELEVNSELDRGSSESGSANDGRGQGKECSAPHCTTDTAHAGALC